MITVTSAMSGAEDVIVRLLTAQLIEHEIQTPAQLLHLVVKAVLSDSRYGFILLASNGGETIGLSYAASHLSAEHGGVVGWLEELYVRPEWRSRGVGTELLAATIARAQELQ